jgi:signal transduction histidine kinase
MLTELRPIALTSDDLPGAMTAFLRRFTARTPLTFTVEGPTHGFPLSPEPSTALLRIVQEAVTNVVRHAQAHTLTVRLWHEPGACLVTVHDDGRGMLPGQCHAPTSLGLLGMRERAAAWGGTVTIEGQPGHDTTVTVRLPCGGGQA